MRSPMTWTVLALAACRSAAAADDDPARGTWKLDGSGTTMELPRGEKGRVAVTIVTVHGVKVAADAPIEVVLRANGLKLDKTKLGKADALDAKSGHPRFEVSFVADEAGSHTVEANLTFFVCTDKWCIRQKDKLAWAVKVR